MWMKNDRSLAVLVEGDFQLPNFPNQRLSI